MKLDTWPLNSTEIIKIQTAKTNRNTHNIGVKLDCAPAGENAFDGMRSTVGSWKLLELLLCTTFTENCYYDGSQGLKKSVGDKKRYPNGLSVLPLMCWKGMFVSTLSIGSLDHKNKFHMLHPSWWPKMTNHWLAKSTTIQLLKLHQKSNDVHLE